MSPTVLVLTQPCSHLASFSWNHMKSLIPQTHRPKKHPIISGLYSWWEWENRHSLPGQMTRTRPRFSAVMGSGRKAPSGRTWEFAERFRWWQMTLTPPRHHCLPSQPTTLLAAAPRLPSSLISNLYYLVFWHILLCLLACLPVFKKSVTQNSPHIW